MLFLVVIASATSFYVYYSNMSIEYIQNVCSLTNLWQININFRNATIEIQVLTMTSTTFDGRCHYFHSSICHVIDLVLTICEHLNLHKTI